MAGSLYKSSLFRKFRSSRLTSDNLRFFQDGILLRGWRRSMRLFGAKPPSFCGRIYRGNQVMRTNRKGGGFWGGGPPRGQRIGWVDGVGVTASNWCSTKRFPKWKPRNRFQRSRPSSTDDVEKAIFYLWGLVSVQNTSSWKMILAAEFGRFAGWLVG